MSWPTALTTKKRLYKAKLHAGRKVKATKQKRKPSQPNKDWRPRWQPSSMFGGNVSVLQSSSSMGSKPGTAGEKPRASLGPCFECGKYGHFRKNCPDLMMQSPGK